MIESGQLLLLKQRRFAPFFWTQFLGAANDSVFKFAVTLLVTYQGPAYTSMSTATAINLIAAVFILPFLLLSAKSFGILLLCVFLMGTHSTLFGPAKYAYLPQHLGSREIVAGNGLVEMGT